MASNKNYLKLFSNIKIGKLEIKNRYFMAPMTMQGQTNTNGVFNEKCIDYFVERAKGGTGLIIMGGIFPDPTVEKVPGLFFANTYENPEEFFMMGKALTEKVHAFGTQMFAQLAVGTGRNMFPSLYYSGSNAISASAVPNRWDPSIIHREMTVEEIKKIVETMGESAALLQAAGFDGIELHAHEAYLIDQFALSLFNHREDKYGGSLENRFRMHVEILKSIKACCGPDFPVIIRLSAKSYIKALGQGALPGEDFKELGRDIGETIEAVKLLEKAGFDGFDIDAGSYEGWYWAHPPVYFEDGMYRPLAKAVKEAVSVPVMVAGRMDNPDIAIEAIEKGETDMIGLGRPLLADPDVPNKILRNKISQIRPCLSCQDGCLFREEIGFMTGCAVNPECCSETKKKIHAALEKKNTAVVGGGPGGLEAARVLALRGHKVTLFEKNNMLGGSLIPGGMPKFKQKDHQLIKWFENEIRRLGVTICYDTTATVEKLKEYDAVVVATGAKPIKIKLPGEEKRKIILAEDVLMNESLVKKDAVIIGGGLVGAELALSLAQHGKKITIVELQEAMLGGAGKMSFANQSMLMDLLNKSKVTCITNTKVDRIIEDGLVISNDKGEQELKTTEIISAVGYKPDNSLFNELVKTGQECYQIGDAQKVANIMAAIWNANEVARVI